VGAGAVEVCPGHFFKEAAMSSTPEAALAAYFDRLNRAPRGAEAQ